MYLITGASRGLGQYLFLRFAAEGADVVGTYHTTPPADRYRDRLFAVDIADAAQVAAFCATLQPRLERVVLINAAGINYSCFAHQADLARWSEVIRVNVLGTFHLIHALLPTMRAQHYGRIINFSSVLARLPAPGVSAYATSKAALAGLARCLAAENGSMNITINNLNLGYFAAGMIREVPASLQARIKARIPTQAFGNPEDIYRAICFLVDTPYLNGAGLDLDGGLT